MSGKTDSFEQFFTGPGGYHFETENGVIVASDAPGYQKIRPLRVEKWSTDEEALEEWAFGRVGIYLENILEQIGEDWESIESFGSENCYENFALCLSRWIEKAESNARELADFRTAIGDTPLEAWKRGEGQARGELAIVIDEIKRIATAVECPLPRDFSAMNFPSNLPDIISAKLETWREEQQAIRRIAAAVDIQEPIVRHFDILNAIAKLKRDITELAAANKAIATENNRIMQTARGIKTTSDKLRECANKLADAEAKLEQLATTENDNCDLRAELERIYEIVGDPKDLEATLLLLVDDGAIETGRRCGFQQGLRFAAERLIDWDQTNQHSSQCAGYLNAWIEPKLSLRTELAATCLDSNSPSLAKAIRSGDRCPEVFRREQDGQLERCRGVLVYEQGHDADRNHPGDPECLYCEECGETFPITNEIVSIVPASEMSEDLQSSEGRSRSSDHRYGTALDIIQSDGQEIGHLEGKIEELERRLAEANSGLDVNVDWLAERITVVVWKTLKLSVSRGDRGRDRLVAAIRHTLENRRADAFTEGVAAIGKSFKVEHFPIVNPNPGRKQERSNVDD